MSELEDLLDHERRALMTAYAQVPAARRATPPAGGGWSAVEIVEHVSRVEAGVAKMLRRAADMPRTATTEELADAQLSDAKIAALHDRGSKWEAPQRTQPTGTLSAESVMEQLQRSRDALLDAYRTAEATALDGITLPHPFIGPLTMRAWVALVAHHDARHAEQMRRLVDLNA